MGDPEIIVGGSDGGTPLSGKCEPFAVRECGIELGTFQGQINCAIAVFFAGCSGAPDDLPPGGSGYERTTRPVASSTSTPPPRVDGGSTTCVSFDTRECVIDLGTVNGIHNCAKGQQICEDGVWTACAVF